jgi:hypothetical protein
MNGLAGSDPPAAVPENRWKRAALLVAIFTVVYGAKLWIVDYAGSAVPFWDQWGAEGIGLFKPFLLGQFSWQTILAPLNEHRIILTKLLALGLFRADGMWDPRLEMVVNATIAAGTAALVAHLILLEMGKAWLRPVAAVVALLWVLPYGWENSVMGIQSLLYFLVLFSFTALWGLSYGPPFTTRWWIGIASVALACLTMASGLLAGLAVTAIRGLAIFQDRKSWRTHWLTMLLGLGLAAAMWLSSRQIPMHDGLFARGPLYFLEFLFKCLSWPALKIPLAFLLLQFPIFVIVRGLFRKKEISPVKWFVLALAIWATMQSVVLAFARGYLGGYPPSRYQDMISIGFLSAFIGLVLEWRQIHPWLRYGWMILATIGLVQGASHDIRRSLPEVRESRMEQARRCRVYVETGNPAILHEVSDPLDIPLGDAGKLAACLDDPQLRSVLIFVPGQEGLGRWPTRISDALVRSSRAIFGLGIFGLLIVLRLYPPAGPAAESQPET